MSIESLRRSISARPDASTASWLPTSGIIGLALPVALLAVVLLGMDLALPSLLAWALACALLMVALPLLPATGVILALTLTAMLLLRLMRGEAVIFTTLESAAFMLAGVLAAAAGHLLQIMMKQRNELEADRSGIDNFEKIFGALFESSRDCVKLLAADGTVVAINQNGLRLAGAQSEKEMVGRNWFSLWDRDAQKALETNWGAALA